MKTNQLVGDYDRERQAPTSNLTDQRYQLERTELGIPSQHKDRIYLLFGDAWNPPDDQIRPTWSSREEDARSLFQQPCIGEFSVSYNQYIDKWIMLYNCGFEQARGINLRTANDPWGPWSDPLIIFDPWDDTGCCNFIQVNWEFENCDVVQYQGRENEWGGEYGPYQFEELAVGNRSSTTIHYTMSTWNPYTVVLMKAALEIQ